jgi:hypothetical protein
MQFIENYPQGYWQVGDQKFINKYQALVHATKTNNYIHFRYFDDVWQNFDRSLIGKYSLKELYKQRAQQLRDSYDYLILYFSGGADSYNVLRSFLDNGIHLDEICVKWANDVIDKDVYLPNTEEVTALNYLSEWDFAIKPVLEEVAQKHPNIKIEIVDWFDDRNSIGKEAVFNLVNHWHDVEVTSLAVWSPREYELTEKGKKVAGIYGIDKPQTYFEDGKAYMIFLDSATTMGTPCPQNIYGTEYFYWSPKFPLLAFEMANVTVNAFNANSDVQKIKFTKEEKTDARLFMIKMGYQQKFLRFIMYDNWTGRFQANKPDQLDRSDKHFWLWKYDELLNYKDSYVDMSNMHYDTVNRGFLLVDQYSGKRLYRPLPSKKHFVSQE